jgi:hypothetical protein
MVRHTGSCTGCQVGLASSVQQVDAACDRHSSPTPNMHLVNERMVPYVDQFDSAIDPTVNDPISARNRCLPCAAHARDTVPF